MEGARQGGVPAAWLEHPHIAPVQAVLQPDPYAAYIQMPYYCGGDLLSWLSSGLREVWRRKALLQQLCEALRHIHSHGIAHGDIKLENVLIHIDGERPTAHLADFESAFQQRADGARTITRTTTKVGDTKIMYTDLYVAPEILLAVTQRRTYDARPTAMGDMFAYGVCCLFAMCLPPGPEEQQAAFDKFEEDDRQLTDWSRVQATEADAHLPDLLEKLLAPATSHEEALDEASRRRAGADSSLSRRRGSTGGERSGDGCRCCRCGRGGPRGRAADGGGGAQAA